MSRFDDNSIRRIAKSVRRTETMPEFEGLKPETQGAYRPGMTVLVKIISEITTGQYLGRIWMRDPDGAIGTYIAATTEYCLVYGTSLAINSIALGKIIFYDATNDRVEVFVTASTGYMLYARIDARVSTNKYSFTEWDGGAVSGGIVGNGTTVYASDIDNFDDTGLANKFALLKPSNITTGKYLMGPWKKSVINSVTGTGSGTCSGGTYTLTLGYTAITTYYIGG